MLVEYRGQFLIHAILNYLDGYPLELPCRYANRVACYTAVYVVSNVDLWEQYLKQPATWAAFLRRIHRVVKFFSDRRQAEYTMQEYMTGFVEIDSTETKDLPF